MIKIDAVHSSLKKNDVGSAISSLKNNVDDLIKQLESNIKDEKERRDIILDSSRKIRQCCDEIKEIAFLGEYGETLEYYRANYDMTSSKMIKATNENRRRYGERVKDISLILISYGDGISSMIGIDKNLLDTAKEQWSYASKLIKEAGDPPRSSSDFLSKYEREEIINKCSDKTKKAEQNYQQKLDEIAKKRHKEYWDNHHDERNTLESEKNQLAERIAGLNKEILSIPENDVKNNLHEQIEKLSLEKKAIGFFRFKEKKAVQIQIDPLKKEISNVEAQINAKTEEIKKRIYPLEMRIQEIDNELTKPR